MTMNKPEWAWFVLEWARRHVNVEAKLGGKGVAVSVRSEGEVMSHKEA